MAKRSPKEALGIILDGGRSINTAELAEELIAAFGGAKRFAQLYFTEFDKGTKAGSIAKARMLDGVLKIVASAGSQNKGKGGSVSDMTDEQLLDELGLLLAGRVPGVADGPKEEAGVAGR